MSRHLPQPQYSRLYWLTWFFFFLFNWSTWLLGYQAITWWIYKIYSIVFIILFSTDWCSSNDVSMTFQKHIEERNSEFPNSQLSFFYMFTTHQLHSYRLLVHLSFQMQPQELGSISELTNPADYNFVYDITFKVTSSLSVAQAKLQFSSQFFESILWIPYSQTQMSSM